MQTEGSSLLHRDRAGEIVNCPARRAEQQDFCCGAKRVEEFAGFVKTDRSGCRADGERHMTSFLSGLHAGNIGYGGASPPGKRKVYHMAYIRNSSSSPDTFVPQSHSVSLQADPSPAIHRIALGHIF